MEFYDDQIGLLDRDFHDLRIHSSPKLAKRYKKILENLNISQTIWEEKFVDNGEYNPSIYEFLLHLAQSGYTQADYIIELIDEKTKYTFLTLALGGTVIGSFLIYLLALPALQVIVAAIKQLLTSILGFPVIGLLYNIGSYAYHFYDNYQDRKKSTFNRVRDTIFLFFSFAPNLTAYLLLIAATATVSMVIAGLFVAAAGVDALREAFCLGQEFFQWINRPQGTENPLEVHRDFARQQHGFKKRVNSFLISLAAAIVIAGITALWCFLPGGIAAPIFAISAICLVYLIKYALLKWNEARSRDELQKQLQLLEPQWDENDSELFNECSAEIQPELSHSQDLTPKLKPTRSVPAAKLPFFSSKSIDTDSTNSEDLYESSDEDPNFEYSANSEDLDESSEELIYKFPR